MLATFRKKNINKTSQSNLQFSHTQLIVFLKLAKPPHIKQSQLSKLSVLHQDLTFFPGCKGLKLIWLFLLFCSLLFPHIHLVTQCEMDNNFCLSIIWTSVWSNPIGYWLDRKVKKPEGKKGSRRLCASAAAIMSQRKRKETKEAGGEDSDDSWVQNWTFFQPNESYTIHEAVGEQDSLITWLTYLLKIQIVVY